MSNISGFCIVIRGKPEKKSKFSRMKDFFREKIGQLMYAIRKQVSEITINGRRVVARPKDYPIELKTLSVKQLGKIQRALTVMNADVNGGNLGDGIYLCRPGFFPPFPSPRNAFDDDDEDGFEIVINDDTESESNSVDDAVFSIKSTTSVNEASVRDEGKVRITENTASSMPAVENTEIPIERQWLLRKNRPKAAKGERNSTMIPSYIIIDKDSDISVSPKRRKRPTAAKGKRKILVESSDLIDLPAEVLVEKLREQETDTKPKVRNRPQAPKCRVRGLSEPLKEDSITKDVATPEKMCDVDKSESEILDELMRELGVTVPHEPKAPINVRHIQVKEYKATEDNDEDEVEDEPDDDIFNLPYLPKSQRTASYGMRFPWQQ